MPIPRFETRDPTEPQFWTDRFEKGFMPWDRGGVPAALKEFVAQSPAPLTTLIPGCGVGYEVAFLSESGWNVTAIDFSPAAVRSAQSVLGQWAERVVEADFFTYIPAQTLDLVYERAFLCALPPDRWASIVERWANLLPSGGLLAGFFFIGDGVRGPPFGIDQDKLNALLQPYFLLEVDQAVEDSVSVFDGKERWQLWRRR